MARRGDQLREHILWTAKEVFLELGFERASMDVVAARAATSKRSLYAHFESKEKLFLAVIELVRGLFLRRLRMPGDYPGPPAEALVMFCGRYLETLLYESSIQMIRLSVAETTRFPAGAAQYFDVIFIEAHTRLSAYLKTMFGLSAALSEEMAQKLLGQILHPRLARALFGLDPLAKTFDRESPSPDFDLRQIREAVADVMRALERHSPTGASGVAARPLAHSGRKAR
ncbi:TetR/AcrR family transcriptional regulator [Methylocapsa sp. S129]|uniref:TetR/AcrR family transcriptional regulator n=1 Tax=Methylocapsa sp. S129 TaxID=1641869 RepID=UPI00131B8B8B|nr:TetR/AcrR family transcriptional regulator [Methylocapsa sp. S129]